MVAITGDTHGDFSRVQGFCERFTTTREDIMIVLGDAGINYYDDRRAVRLKDMLKELSITLFCLHGNHENRPQNIPTYKEIEWHGGMVYTEEPYPNLLLAKDGELFDIDALRCIAIGGAYSVDKFYRRSRGFGWWSDEQPSEQIKRTVLDHLEAIGNKVDVVLSHTCPHKYIPREVFLPMIDQSTVDNSTEHWLDSIESRIQYKKWYCGHYHTEKRIDKMQFLFESIDEFYLDEK